MSEATSADLRGTINESMTICRVVWNQFALQRLHDFLNIRRIHSMIVLKNLTPEDHTEFRPLLAAVDAMTAEGGYTALIANLAITVCLRSSSAELAAYYFCRAGSIAIQNHFGQQLQDELAYLAVANSHLYHWKLGSFMERILDEHVGRESVAATILRGVDEANLCSQVLRLLNASNGCLTRHSGASSWLSSGSSGSNLDGV